MAKDKKFDTSKIAEFGSSRTIEPEVMEFLEDEIPTILAPGLQDIYDAGFEKGKESREGEVVALKEELQAMKKKVEAILNALA